LDNLYLNYKDTYWPTMEEKRSYADKLNPSSNILHYVTL